MINEITPTDLQKCSVVNNCIIRLLASQITVNTFLGINVATRDLDRVRFYANSDTRRVTTDEIRLFCSSSFDIFEFFVREMYAREPPVGMMITASHLDPTGIVSVLIEIMSDIIGLHCSKCESDLIEKYELLHKMKLTLIVSKTYTQYPLSDSTCEQLPLLCDLGVSENEYLFTTLLPRYAHLVRGDAFEEMLQLCIEWGYGMVWATLALLRLPCGNKSYTSPNVDTYLREILDMACPDSPENNFCARLKCLIEMAHDNFEIGKTSLTYHEYRNPKVLTINEAYDLLCLMKAGLKVNMHQITVTRPTYINTTTICSSPIFSSKVEKRMHPTELATLKNSLVNVRVFDELPIQLIDDAEEAVIGIRLLLKPSSDRSVLIEQCQRLGLPKRLIERVTRCLFCIPLKRTCHRHACVKLNKYKRDRKMINSIKKKVNIL